jgi:hypothetical protein
MICPFSLGKRAGGLFYDDELFTGIANCRNFFSGQGLPPSPPPEHDC